MMQQRPIAITTAALMGSVGGGFGYIMHLFFVSPSDIHHEKIAQDHIFNLCLFAAIAFTVILAVCLAIIREKPPIPPTKSANNKTHESFLVSIGKLMKNKNFVLIANGFGFVYSVLMTFSQEVAFIIAPFGYNNADNALFGAVFVVSGLVGAGVVATILSKTKKYQHTLIFVCFGSTIAACLETLTLLKQSRLLTSIGVGLLGGLLLSIMAVGLDYACELSYPVPAHNATGIILAFSHVICPIHIIVTSYVLTAKDHYGVQDQKNSLIVSTMLFGTCLLYTSPSPRDRG
eukprot:TRINITY_DN1715_c0_g1_i3.p1 TRINITY_DN1715_c0_g1~~TRINITY_DN1715_c0_g1_i3.p1  ORF type:complete len:289 (+),score=26.84 TRINITY_DN1715_c0_g1_i3:556-1422(+)